MGIKTLNYNLDKPGYDDSADIAVIGDNMDIIDTALAGKQNALGFTPENSANKGQANGYAGLDAQGKVPAAQLPAAAGGDMFKSVYDTDNDGVVDDAEKLGGQAPEYYATTADLGDKVDKVAGKGLSTEDYTTGEKQKLAGIEDGANNYVHPTTAGSKHIPVGGMVGQVLKNAAGGTAEWADESGGDPGTFGINIETLTADKTLTKDDVMYQYLDPGTANRNITLPTDAAAGKVFVIRNNGPYDSPWFLSIAGIDMMYAGSTKTFVFNGTNWIGGENGTGEDDNKKFNLAIGFTSIGIRNGVAVGSGANGSSNGVAVGYGTNGANSGTAIGSGADGSSNGVAVGSGAQTTRKNYAVAKGYSSKAFRWNEEVKSSDGSTTTKYSYSTLAWHKETTDATQVEIFLGGTTNQRATVLASSAFGFSIYITALNNADGKGKRWKIEGLIKRDGSNNTALVGSVVKTVIAQSDASGGTQGWDVVVTADDTNEALKIEVKGEADKALRWICRGEIEEVRF